MSILTKEGFGALRFASLVLVVGIGVAVFLVGGSYVYWQSEKTNNIQSKRTLNDMQSRLANAKRERDDLRNSEDTYKALTARGVFITERRLDLLDAMEALKLRHNIVTLEYQVSEQRPLKLAGGATISAVDALGSRIRLKASAIHDGDIVGFLDEFPRLQRGLFPIDRCVIKRSLGALQADAEIARKILAQKAGVSGAPDGGESNKERENAAIVMTPAIEAECALEWITLVDKRAAAEVSSAAKLPDAGAGK